MPKLNLIPTLSEPCPECRTEAIIPFVSGRQVMKCTHCDANLSFEFPASSNVMREILDKVRQVEKVLDEAYFNRP